MSWLDDFAAAAQERLGAREREAAWARGVSESQINTFRVGYIDRVFSGAPPDFVRFSKGGARLDDSFVLPLTNVLGQIKGLQFRHVSPEVRGYQTYYADPPRDESVYFGLGQAVPFMWETERVFVVEGAFDVFPIQRVFPETFAALTLGTSQALARMLRRFVKQVWLGYDNDRPGVRAAQEFKTEYGADLDVRPMCCPQVRQPGGKVTKDWAELWMAVGDAKVKEFLRKQVTPYG